MFKLLSVVFLLQVVIGNIDCVSMAKRAVVDYGTWIESCTQEPIELGIVMDSSSSIPAKDFVIGKNFLQEFIKHFEIGQDGVRVSIITYGYGIYPEDGFNLTTYNNKDDLVTALGNIPHRHGLRTDTGRAIEYMHEVQLSPNVARSYAEKVSIVITDGNSQEWRFTKKMAEEARADGITILAVGVGRGVREEELLNIAGNISNVIKVESYERLPSVMKILASQSCVRKEKPTTTPEPKTEKCGEVNPTDINFVFSPAGLGPDATSWTTSFILSTISTEDLDVGFQYGVVSGSCPDDRGFNLNAYNTFEQYKERLDRYESKKLPELLQRLADDGYSREAGGRDGASKVAVIVTNGIKGGGDRLSSYVQQLTEIGVTVYIADTTGNGIHIDGAIGLTGRSAKAQAETLATYLCPQ